MKMTQFLKGIIIVTALSIIYINLQVQIYDFAYQAKRKEKEIRKLVDHNGNMNYGILKLKSANHLGVKLLAENSKMQFLDNHQVVKLQTHVPSRNEARPAVTQDLEKKYNLFATIFSLKSQAEAKQ